MTPTSYFIVQIYYDHTCHETQCSKYSCTFNFFFIYIDMYNFRIFINLSHELKNDSDSGFSV